MTLTISYFKDSAHPEVPIMCRLLDWQEINYDLLHAPKEVMLASKAKGTPCIIYDGEIVAVGFFELVDWIRKEGRVLL
jgi:hypothetical protein